MFQASGGFNYGWGNNPYDPTRSADFLGATPYGPGMGYSGALGAANAAHNMFNTVNMVGMGASMASGFGIGGAGLATFGRVAGGLGFGGMVMPMVAPMMVGQALGAGVHAMQNQASTHNIMNQIAGTRNMGGYGGIGFNSQSAKMLNDTVRELAAIPDMLTNQGELQNIMKGLSNMKLMQSARNAKEMGERFTTIVKTMRDMSKELNTTLENVMPYIEQMNNQGYFSLKDMRRGASMTHATSSVGIGMNERNLLNLQATGADIIRGYGGRKQVGAEFMRDMAGQVSVGVQKGMIGEETLFNVTGKRGEEAVADMSQKMMSANARIMQSDAGRFIAAALGKQNDQGEYTGQIDKDLLNKFNTGALSAQQLKEMASGKLSTEKAATSLQTNMARGMGAEFGAQMGVGGLAKSARALLKDSNMSDEQIKLWLQNTLQEEQVVVDAIFEMSDKSEKLKLEFDKQIQETQKRNRMMSALKERSVGARFQKLKTSMGHTMFGGIENAATDYMTQFSEAGDLASWDFANGRWGKGALRYAGAVFGIQPTSVTGRTEGAQDYALASAMTGKNAGGKADSESQLSMGVENFLGTNRWQQGFDVIGGIADTYGSGDTMRDYNANKFFGVDRSAITNDYLTRLEKGEIAGSAASKFVKDTIRDGMASGKSTTQIVEELKNSARTGGGDIYGQLQSLEKEGGGMGKAAAAIKRDLIKEIRGGAGSKSSSDMRNKLIEDRAEMFGTNSMGGLLDFNMLSGEVNELDSSIFTEIFGAKSSTSIKDQSEYAKLLDIISQDKNSDFLGAAMDEEGLDKYLKEKGIKLSAKDIQGSTLDEFKRFAGEAGGASDIQRINIQRMTSKLKSNIKQQSNLENYTARTDLFKYTFDEKFSETNEGKLLKQYAEGGDISKLDELVRGLSHENIAAMGEGKHKDLLAETFASREGMKNATAEELRQKALSMGLSEQDISGMGTDQLRTRLATRPILEKGRALGDKSNDELIAEAGGYSAEVAQAVADANVATTRYIEETGNTIEKQRMFNEKTAEAIIKISNSMKQTN